MMNRLRNVAATCAALAALLVGAGSASAGLVNGGIEDTSNTYVANAPGPAMSLPVGSTTIPGWEVVSGELAWIPSGSFGLTPHEGTFFLDLAGFHDSAPYGGIQQTVATQVGAGYSLSYWLGGVQGTSAVTASAGATSGTFSYLFGGTADWQQGTLSFIATSNLTTISLIGAAASNGGNYIGLDDVTLIQTSSPTVPEPSSLALLGLGGIGSAIGACRRRRAVV